MTFRLILLILYLVLGGGCAYDYRTVAFRVFDATTTQPIRGAKVESSRLPRFMDLRPDAEWASGISDANGLVVLDIPTHHMEMNVWAGGYELLVIRHDTVVNNTARVVDAPMQPEK